MNASTAAANSSSTLRLLLASSLLIAVGCGRPSGEPASATTYSAGYVLREEVAQVSHDFSFKNTSLRTVTIKKVTKSCSCAQVSVDRMLVEPGRTALITMVIGVPDVLVRKSAACTIETDDPLREAVQYSVDFTSLPNGLLEPPEITVERSEFASDAVVLKSVSLHNFDRVGSDDFESVMASGVPGVDVSSVGMREEKDLGNRIVKRSRVVQLRIRNVEDEAHAGSRKMLSLSVPAAKLRVSLRILFRDSGGVHVWPTAVNFGVLKATEGLTRFVTLRLDDGDRSIEDLRLESDSDALQPKITTVERATATVSLRLEPTRFHTKELGDAVAVTGAVRIRLRGTVVARVPWAVMLR